MKLCFPTFCLLAVSIAASLLFAVPMYRTVQPDSEITTHEPIKDVKSINISDVSKDHIGQPEPKTLAQRLFEATKRIDKGPSQQESVDNCKVFKNKSLSCIEWQVLQNTKSVAEWETDIKDALGSNSGYLVKGNPGDHFSWVTIKKEGQDPTHNIIVTLFSP